MFKGLRTKIESEQHGHTGGKSSSTVQNIDSTPHEEHNEDALQSDKPIAPPDVETQSSKHEATIGPNITSDKGRNDEPAELSIKEGDSKQKGGGDYERLLQTVEELKDEVSGLHNRLQSVIKERDESNDQNAQLYQLIEKLRRNLESEKETNSSLQSKLDEVESNLKDKINLIDGLESRSSTNISIKSFEPSHLNSSQSSESSDVLHKRITDLQNQLSEKTRQLRISQQNLTDMKKTLQREMTDHNRTKDELIELQNQFKQLQLQQQDDVNDNAAIMNGSTFSDADLKNNNSNQAASDKQDHSADSVEETKSTGMAAQQLDTISCLSRSSTSVDDYDSNDLQHSCNKVNLEYLRNVLYRYMTTTDTETAQHLIKALSVLMNFTPEQSAAVKSAMYARSSWLRLK